MQRRTFLETLLLGVPAAWLGVPAAAAETRGRQAAVDIGFVRKNLPLVPRTDWTRTEPVYRRLRPAQTFTRLTVHHSGAAVTRSPRVEDIVAALNGVMTSHRDRHYGDIGYHFVVDYAGRVWEGRKLAYEGAHVLNENHENLAVMLLGNYETQQPCIRQLTTLGELVKLLRDRFDISPEAVFGHRDLGASVCPGRSLYPYVRELRCQTPKPSGVEKT